LRALDICEVHLCINLGLSAFLCQCRGSKGDREVLPPGRRDTRHATREWTFSTKHKVIEDTNSCIAPHPTMIDSVKAGVPHFTPSRDQNGPFLHALPPNLPTSQQLRPSTSSPHRPDILDILGTRFILHALWSSSAALATMRLPLLNRQLGDDLDSRIGLLIGIEKPFRSPVLDCGNHSVCLEIFVLDRRWRIDSRNSPRIHTT
jgi:hypothetical protein